MAIYIDNDANSCEHVTPIWLYVSSTLAGNNDGSEKCCSGTRQEKFFFGSSLEKRTRTQIWQLGFLATFISLSLSQLHAYPCLSPVTKQDALNYTRTLPSPFLRPLSVFYPFSHNCSFACCATTVAADRATNIKFEINKSKQFSRSGDMRGKSGRGWFHERLLESRRTDRSCKIGR